MKLVDNNTTQQPDNYSSHITNWTNELTVEHSLSRNSHSTGYVSTFFLEIEI
jgi:hypothetical protein